MIRPAPKHRRPPTATPAELELFRAALRDARPLAPRARKPAEPALPKRETPVTAAPAKPPPPRPVATAPPPNPGLDRRTAERLRRGDMPIERRLDLHGMTQGDAHAALDHFVRKAWDEGKRMLLVITGKGSLTGGVLRTGVPRWLAAGENAARVLRVESAQARHGGGGAYYVLLRRRREES